MSSSVIFGLKFILSPSDFRVEKIATLFASTSLFRTMNLISLIAFPAARLLVSKNKAQLALFY
jgi:hypothetical protein